MPHLEDFFTHDAAGFCAGSGTPEDSKPGRREGGGVPDSGVLYLHGPNKAGQTSLLLQLGFTQAQKGASVVLVICGRAGLSQQPATSEIVTLTACSKCGLPVQTGQDNSTWSRTHLKYLESSAQLQHFLCSLQVVDKETSVLLVDGFERFFADQSHMGDVYQTLAFLVEVREYMKTATGSGVVVVAGHSDAFLLQNRPLLRRWCRFLEIVPDVEEPNIFTLREEVESAANVSESAARTQVRYEFMPPGNETNGSFQLIQVQTRSAE